MTHFDYSVLKQQVTGLPRTSSARLASVQRRQFRSRGEQQAGRMPDVQVSCPIIDIEWARDVMSSSRKSSIPLSGWIRLSVAAQRQISVAGHTLPPAGRRTLARLAKAAMPMLIKAKLTRYADDALVCVQNGSNNCQNFCVCLEIYTIYISWGWKFVFVMNFHFEWKDAETLSSCTIMYIVNMDSISVNNMSSRSLKLNVHLKNFFFLFYYCFRLLALV